MALFVFALTGCSSQGSGNPTGQGSGGASGSGGSSVGTGGSATGGRTGTGGVAATGGSTGGAGASGGSGGQSASGGVIGTGGRATGGAGGSPGTGGMAGRGGSGGAGGAAVAAGTIFVAPNGDDGNPGTMAQPLKTLVKAQAVVRGMNSSMTRDITVYLRGGTYQQTSTLTFSNADSGTGGFYVKYLAYQNEQPIISGGKPITGWTVSDATNNIYSVSGVTTAFRQLYVNGVKAIRARTPNLPSGGGFAFNRLTGADNTNENIQVAGSEVGNWNNLTKVEMHVMTGWGDNTVRVASISTSGGTAYVKIQSPESTVLFVRPYPHLGGQFGGFTKHVYYWENAYEFLDQAGEWYLNETTNVLYYKPRQGEDMTKATVVAPMVETVVAINGASTSSQAGYLWFQGITFAHATYMRPSQSGFMDAQAGQYNLTATSDNKQTIGRPPAGVSVTNANHVHFERDIFTQMGATGLDLVSGTHDDTIIGNVVTDIAGNGISIGKFTQDSNTEYHVAYNPSDKNEICTSDTIKDNYIHNVTTEFQGACGIAAGYPRQVDIEHNEIAYTNYTGISVGYGWTSSTNAMSNNLINANNVHHVTQILADGAGLYTLSNQQPASQMENNYLHDYTTPQWADYGDNGIYLDEQTSGYTVAHNAMVNAPTNVVQNKNGTNTITDTPAGSPSSIMSAAGIESAYQDIKTLTIPAATF